MPVRHGETVHQEELNDFVSNIEGISVVNGQDGYRYRRGGAVARVGIAPNLHKIMILTESRSSTAAEGFARDLAQAIRKRFLAPETPIEVSQVLVGGM